MLLFCEFHVLLTCVKRMSRRPRASKKNPAHGGIVFGEDERLQEVAVENENYATDNAGIFKQFLSDVLRRILLIVG